MTAEVPSDAHVLLTGATGRLGRCLLEELLRGGCELSVVVRATSSEAARERVHAVVRGGTGCGRLTALCGDVTEPGLGLRRRERDRLRSSVDVVLHAAATTRFSTPLEAARRTNVVATKNVLAFATRMRGLSRIAHVSTAFVAGKRTGRVFESDLEHASGFQNGYQQSKYEAELLVHDFRDTLPVRVFRPSVVLDEVDGGATGQRSAFRFALELVKRGLLPALPGTPSTPVDLVTESDAARAIVALLWHQAHGMTYHVAGGERSPTLGAIVDPFADVRYLGVEQYRWEVAKWRRERPRFTPLYDELESFIFELAYPKLFDTTNTEATLGGPVALEDPLVAVLDHGSGAADTARAESRS